ncbi:MAG: hypothetical protein QXH17_02485 [Candidatus Bathyarchaeia archaeon]
MILLTTVIGRLDGYFDATFIIDSAKHTGKLPCEAIYKFFSSSGEDTYLLIFVPESLAINLSDDSSQLENLLRCPEKIKKQFHQKLEALVPLIDKNSLNIVLTPSQGEYKNRNKTVTAIFDNSVTNISSFMFSQLLLFLEKMEEKTIIIDISTGQNLYVTSLLEAARGVLVYEKLNSIAQSNENIYANIAYVPPITSENQEIRIEFHPYDVKAFFELPIKEKNINLNHLIQLSYTDQHKYSEEVRKIYGKLKKLKMHLTTGRLAYNAIKYNIPLFLFHEKMSVKLARFEEIKNFPIYLYDVINAIEKEHKCVQKYNETISVIRNYRINKDLFLNIHFHLALLNSIYNFWKEKIEGRPPTLEYIRQTFLEVYGKLRLGLNSKFLERDCNEISMLVNNYKGNLTSTKLLEEIKGELRDQRPKPFEGMLSDRKRNFFAHSGFLFNITEVSKNNGDILLSYNNDSYEREIEIWMDNPEG